MMAFRIDINKDYLEKALDLAIGAATRASNQKGLNPMIRELHQKDAAIWNAAKIGITEIK